MRGGNKHLKEAIRGGGSNEYKNKDCTIEEMALRGIVSACCTTTNTILFDPDDLPSCDVQYQKLLEFINAASEPFKSQLTHLVYPLFVQFYIELIRNGKTDEAQQFFSKHSFQFEQIDGYKNIIGDLLTISSLKDVNNHYYFKFFREDKYVIELSEECREYFLLYLKEMNHTTLLHLLNLYFSLECEDIETDAGLEIRTSTQKMPCKVSEPSPTNDASSESSPSSFAISLKEAISKVKRGPPSLPSIAMYNISEHTWQCSSVACSSSSALIAGGYEESVIQIWDALSEGIHAPKLWALPENRRIQIDSTSRTFANHIALPDTNLQESKFDDGKSQVRFLRGHHGPVYGMSFTSDGQHLLSCSADTTVQMWNIKNCESIGTYSGHAYPIWDIDISSLSLYFATASIDNTSRLWTIDRLFPLHIFVGHTSSVDCVKFHPNCNYIATGSMDETVRLWSVQDSHMVRLFPGHLGCIRCLAFSPDGQYLASAGEDQKIKIWDLRSGSLLKNLVGHTDTICSLSFNHSGTLLASGGRDQSVKLWDAEKALTTSTSEDASTESAENAHSPELLTSYSVESPLHLLSFELKDVLFAIGVS